MNKLIVAMVALCVIRPMTAMEEQKHFALSLTSKENHEFSCQLFRTVGFGKQMIEEKKIPEDNPLYNILSKLYGHLSYANHDLLKMITVQGLAGRIEEYKMVDLNPLVSFTKEQVKKKVGDVNAAQRLLVANRRTLAELELAQKQPTYSPIWIGTVKLQDKINFMRINENYPVDEESMKDYSALFIYSIVFASQI